MDRVKQYNPFAKREAHSQQSVATYKILTTVTWLLSVVVSFYYTFNSPDDGVWERRAIWNQNAHFRTAFRMNHIIASVYWVVLFVLQGGYIAHLFSSNPAVVNSACAVGSHFILNNLFHFAFVMLFVRSIFGWAELMLILNFFNLSMMYFRHSRYARFIHAPVVSGPLAWTFVAIFWNGAIMVPSSQTHVARIFGNIFIWGILLFGMFFIVVYRDYTMGFNLTVLSAAIGVAQFFDKIVALQWIFAFSIMAALFVATVVVAIPAAVDRVREGDSERAPLLADNHASHDSQVSAGTPAIPAAP
ncbi:DUF1774-domain-containing protein [Xylaria sp. CBS 124048]|nr:DUF1774-domain-containing protein [Xylaria sp. CBS 124048]